MSTVLHLSMEASSWCWIMLLSYNRVVCLLICLFVLSSFLLRFGRECEPVVWGGLVLELVSERVVLSLVLVSLHSELHAVQRAPIQHGEGLARGFDVRHLNHPAPLLGIQPSGI